MKAVPAGDLTDMVGKYLNEKTGVELTPGMFQAFMIVSDENDFVGGVVVTNFRGTDCEMSCAAETPAAWRHDVLNTIFSYVFLQLGCVRTTAITTKRNKRARDFLEALGFQLEGNLRLGYDGRIDALIYGLLARECRYIAVDGEVENGQEIRAEGSGSAGPDANGASADAAEHRVSDGASELEQDRSSYAARLFDVHAERG